MEVWRPVVGYEGFYAVSSLGGVRSLERVITRSNGTPQTIRPRRLSSVVGGAGYPVVTLWMHNKGRTRTVHSLVAEAFLGPCPEGMEVCHNDGNPTNPHKDNLRYDTHQNNLMDTVRAGTNRRVTDRCPYGHLKMGANRVAHGQFGTRSKCRACSREHSLATKYKRPFDSENADRKYREMMEEK